jgi:hypothetical protein
LPDLGVHGVQHRQATGDELVPDWRDRRLLADHARAPVNADDKGVLLLHAAAVSIRAGMPFFGFSLPTLLKPRRALGRDGDGLFGQRPSPWEGRNTLMGWR